MSSLFSDLESVTNWSLQMSRLVKEWRWSVLCPGRQNKRRTKGCCRWAGLGLPPATLGDSVWSFWSGAGLPRGPDSGWSALCFETQGFQVLGAQCYSDFDLLIPSLTTGFQSSEGDKVAQRDSGHVWTVAQNSDGIWIVLAQAPVMGCCQNIVRKPILVCTMMGRKQEVRQHGFNYYPLWESERRGLPYPPVSCHTPSAGNKLDRSGERCSSSSSSSSPSPSCRPPPLPLPPRPEWPH